MTYPRSIRARLITLYVVTLTLIFVCFGGYTYWGLKEYLVQALQKALIRRAHQIASTILVDLPQKGEGYVASEIQARYAPELNERIIRITDQSGRVLYASGNANVLSKPPSLPAERSETETGLFQGEEAFGEKQYLQVVAVGYQLKSGAGYIVEVGTSEMTFSAHWTAC